MGRGSSTVPLQVREEHFHHLSIIVSVGPTSVNQMSHLIEHGCAVIVLGRLENHVLDFHQMQAHSLKFYRMKQHLESLAAAEYFP